MPDLRGRRAALFLAAVVLILGALVLAGLIRAASGDSEPRAWLGRALGFVMAGVAFAVGAAMIAFARPGETHYWGVVAMLTLAALLTGAYSYKTKAPQIGARAQAIPINIGGWMGTDEPVTDSTKRVLGTDDIVMRSYRRGSDLVVLAVVFSESKRKVAHPPEQCYTASGNELEDLDEDSFTTADGREINGRRLILLEAGAGPEGGETVERELMPAHASRHQAVLYWYRAGSMNTGNFLKMQFRVILDNLLMQSSGIVGLIRLSTPMAGLGEKEKAMARLKDFARDVFPEIEAALK